MTILFDWYENPKPNDEQETTLHARPCFSRKVTTRQLIRDMQRRCTLTPADILAVLSELNCVVGEYLREGCQVHIDGLGYFSPTLTVKGKVTSEIPLRDRNRMVRFKDVNFRMDKELQRSVGNPGMEMAGWETHSAKLSEEETEARLTAYFRENSFITRQKLQDLLRLKRTSAATLLKQLCEAGSLLNEGTDRVPVYVPAPGCYGTPAAR